MRDDAAGMKIYVTMQFALCWFIAQHPLVQGYL